MAIAVTYKFLYCFVAKEHKTKKVSISLAFTFIIVEAVTIFFKYLYIFRNRKMH